MWDCPEPQALPARQEVHLHFHDVTAEDVAAILARVNHDDHGRGGQLRAGWRAAGLTTA